MALEQPREPLQRVLDGPAPVAGPSPRLRWRFSLPTSLILPAQALVLLVVLARRLTGLGPLAAGITVTAVALSPAMLFPTGFVWSESLIAPLFVGCVLALLRFQEAPSVRRGLVVAVLCGAGFVTHSRLLPLSITLLLAAAGVPRLFPNASPRRVVQIGFFALFAGIVIMLALLNIGAGPEIITWPMLLAGLGVGALASQLGSVTVSAVPDEQSGDVGGVQNTVTNLGASIGTALAGAVLPAGGGRVPKAAATIGPAPWDRSSGAAWAARARLG